MGQQAPDFTLDALDGTSYTLSQKTAGHPTVLVFWQTIPIDKSRQVVDELNQLSKNYASQGLQILLVNSGQPRLLVDGYFRGPGHPDHPYPVLLDENTNVYNNNYHGTDFPMYFFINKDRIIADQVAGYIDYSALQGRTAPLLP